MKNIYFLLPVCVTAIIPQVDMNCTISISVFYGDQQLKKSLRTLGLRLRAFLVVVAFSPPPYSNMMKTIQKRYVYMENLLENENGARVRMKIKQKLCRLNGNGLAAAQPCNS